MRRFEPQEVEVSIEVTYEDISIEGNVMASGDGKADHQAEIEVRTDLESGNIFAWCIAVIKASWAGFERQDTLGGISCHNEDGFRSLVMDHEMIEQAVGYLIKDIRRHGWYIDVPNEAESIVAKRFQHAEIEMR